MINHSFDITITDSGSGRVTKTVTARNMAGALERACQLAVKSGIAEHARRAVVERRDA